MRAVCAIIVTVFDASFFDGYDAGFASGRDANASCAAVARGIETSTRGRACGRSCGAGASVVAVGGGKEEEVGRGGRRKLLLSIPSAGSSASAAEKRAMRHAAFVKEATEDAFLRGFIQSYVEGCLAAANDDDA